MRTRGHRAVVAGQALSRILDGMEYTILEPLPLEPAASGGRRDDLSHRPGKAVMYAGARKGTLHPLHQYATQTLTLGQRLLGT